MIDTPSSLLHRFSPARIAFIYAVFGLLWISLSDQILAHLVADADTLTRLQTYKGWLFILLTTGLVYFLVYDQDSRNQQAERELQESQRFLTNMMGNVPGMVYRCRNDSNWTMEFASAGSVTLTGYSPDALIHNRDIAFADLIHPEDSDRIWDEIQQQVRKDQPYIVAYRITTRLGEERWVWEKGSACSLPGQKQTLEGIIIDITEQKRAQQEAELQRGQLAHVTRLGTMGEMATGIAHEINQPLTAIANYALACRRLLDKDPASPGLQLSLQKISDQTFRAAEVIRKLRSFVKRSESEREQVDCNALIREVEKLAEVETHINNVPIRQELAEKLPAVVVDPVQIQQVVLNLVRNAMEAMISANSPEPEIIIRSSLVNGATVVVSVEDNGPGIDADRQEEIFTPFYSTKESGMGMGLSISRTIIASHGGQLDYALKPTGGSRFTFSLPAIIGE